MLPFATRRLQLPLEEGRPWRATKAALKAYLAANDGAVNPFSQAVTTTPPTIRVQAYPLAAPDNDLTVAHLYSAGANVFRYEGGGDKPFAGTTFRRFPADTYAATSGNLGNGENGDSWQVRVSVTSSKVAFYVLGSTLKYRFTVDGRYVDKVGTLTAATTGHQLIILDFGSRATRLISIESEQGTGFAGMYVAPGDLVARPAASPFRLLALGDSFTSATGAGVFGDGYVAVTAGYLALTDRWMSGPGGTGYLAKGSGSAYYSLPERLLADLGRFKAFGSPDMILVAMGLNDVGLIGVQAAANGVFDTIRATAPTALVFVLGPWDTTAPAAPSAAYSTTKSQITAAATGRAGFWFIDPQGRTYTKSDGTHPDAAGHFMLGQWLATQIRTTIAA